MPDQAPNAIALADTATLPENSADTSENSAVGSENSAEPWKIARML
jgi:hypothetical protein